MKKTLFLFCLFFIVSCRLSSGELVIITGPERKTCGFLAVNKGKTYLYTSQSAIFGMKLVGINYSFNAVTLSGKKISTSGSLELSPDRDVARIQVQGEFPDAFQIGNINNIGQEITLFPEAINKNAEKTQVDEVTGLGIYAFTFETALEENSPGSPVLNEEGKVIGILCGWRDKIIIVSQKSPSFQSEVVKANLAGRVSPFMDWVSTGDADFVTAGDAIYEASRLQKEFLPLLNWWFENPYRLVGPDVQFPKDLKRFVQYNNERARRIDVHLKTMKSNHRKHENLLRAVRDKCVHRAKLFQSFPKSQHAKMEAEWKTKFLKDRAAMSAENWDFVIPYIKARARSMEYRLPYNF